MNTCACCNHKRTENEYVPFIVNRAMGYGKDTVIAGNEMNSRSHLDNKCNMYLTFIKIFRRNVDVAIFLLLI